MLRFVAVLLLVASLLASTTARAEDGERRRAGPVYDYSRQELGATFHYWKDEAGRVHFTNRPELVPPRYNVVPIPLFVAPPERG